MIYWKLSQLTIALWALMHLVWHKKMVRREASRMIDELMGQDDKK